MTTRCLSRCFAGEGPREGREIIGAAKRRIDLIAAEERDAEVQYAADTTDFKMCALHSTPISFQISCGNPFLILESECDVDFLDNFLQAFVSRLIPIELFVECTLLFKT
jgi:hypothetical protein